MRRLLASWTFEDGESFVVYCTDKAVVTDVLDMLEQMIKLRREEITRKAHPASQGGPT